MSTTTDLSTLKINYLTQAQYNTALANDEINQDELYMTTDGFAVPSTTAYTDTSLKNIIESTSDPGSTSAPNGTVWLKYGDSTLPTMADYVVDEYLSGGTAGDWSWRKWNSGIFECWATHSVTLTADSTTGDLYYSQSVYVHLPKLTNTTYLAQGAVCNVMSGSSMMWAANCGVTAGTPTGTPGSSNTAGTAWFRAMRALALPTSAQNFRLDVKCKWANAT